MEKFIIGLLLFCVIILIIILLIQKKNIRNNSMQIYMQKNDELAQIGAAVDSARQLLSSLKNEAAQQQNKLESLSSSYDILHSQFVNQQQRNQDYIANEQSLIKQQLDNWLKSEKEKLTIELNVYKLDQKYKAQQECDEYIENIDQLCEDYTEQLTLIQYELDDFKQKRQQINEEIIRQRAINEQQDFYRINLTSDNQEDIAIISSIREKLHKREYLDKMLYDNYVSKSVKEMTKRVLKGNDPSGIYKITNIQTNEIYIGKSTGVATRWTNHIKSACGLEGVADSRFQRALKKYGIENWTFELLEEVPKDKLTEREKYYIIFYESNKYGYNDRVG